MNRDLRDTKKAIAISAFITAIVFGVGAFMLVDWSALDSFFPTPATPITVDDGKPDIAASLDYIKTLPAYDATRDATLAYEKTTPANDGVAILEFVGAAPMRYLVLWQNGRIIGHEVQVTDETRVLTLVSPEPETIFSLSVVPVRGLTKPNQVVTLALKLESGNGTIETREVRSDESGHFNLALQPVGIRSGRYTVQASIDEATVSIPVIFSLSK